MVAHFYQTSEKGELDPPFLLVQHTLRAVDHDLQAFKFIHDIKEDEVLSDDSL